MRSWTAPGTGGKRERTQQRHRQKSSSIILIVVYKRDPKNRRKTLDGEPKPGHYLRLFISGFAPEHLFSSYAMAED